MTDHYSITPPDKLLDEWSREFSHIEFRRLTSGDPNGLQAIRRDFLTMVARWGAREVSETPKQKLQRLINKTGNEELIEAFEQLQEEDS